MFEILQRAKHHVSTAFGVSDESRGGVRRNPPLEGVGQGNGAGPATWAVIRTVITAAMATHGHGFNVMSATSCALVSFVCHAFVDDADVIHAAPSVAASRAEVIVEMQGVLDR
jgi:hypothetical protein